MSGALKSEHISDFPLKSCFHSANVDLDRSAIISATQNSCYIYDTLVKKLFIMEA